jgi:hypothetical protein
MTLLIALGLAGVLIQSPAAAPAAALSGRVVEEGSLTPVAGAQVTLIPMMSAPSPRRFHERPPAAITDGEGRYRFDSIGAGRYQIAVQKSGFASPNAFGLPEVQLAAGERRDDMDVTVQKGAAIVGRVINASGEPVVDARVMAMQKPRHRSNGPPISRDVLMPAGSGGQTNDLGEFRLFGLPAGEYYVQAMARPEFGESPVPRGTVMLATYFPGTSDAGAAQAIAVGPGETSAELLIQMIDAPAFQVSGVVVDANGQPVENALVRLIVDESMTGMMFMLGPWSPSRTDAAGRFTIDNVTSGTYTLLAAAPVVLSGRADGRGVTGGSNGGGFTSFGWSSGGTVSGGIGGGVMTETRDGQTVQYRDDTATRVPITVDQANLRGLQVVVRPPPR